MILTKVFFFYAYYLKESPLPQQRGFFLPGGQRGGEVWDQRRSSPFFSFSSSFSSSSISSMLFKFFFISSICP